MTAPVLVDLVENLTDEEATELERLLALRLGRRRTPRDTREPKDWIDGTQFPALVAIWDNDDDAVYDNL